ncbi:MAG: aminotransferase class V-fold PLP-dependent enzyme [Candidatus Nanopelagicales bacterium]|nr:aminotransferase class V-fold PLP-dependent enzyme [Candidatus Nanopelagicales bacterium]
MAADVSSYRYRFPVFENVTYLNSCSQGALADTVRAAMIEYLDGMDDVGSLWGTWVGKQEEVRGLIAQVLGADVSEVSVTSSASAAVSAIASSLFDGSRRKVVTTSLEFPTIGQIWHAQERRGVEVVHVPAQSDNTLDLAALAAAIDDDTQIVSVTHVCYRNGAMTDIDAIVKLAHDRGALVLVDSYQATGAVPIDFHALGADFLVGGCLKYMLGVPGVGFALVNAATTSELIPTITGWFAARDIFAMDINSYDPAKDARRFEGGTPPVPSTYPVAAGLNLLLEVGVERAWHQSSMLHDMLRAGIADMGGRVVTPASTHGPMLAVASTDENALVAAMGEDGVIVSCRDGNVRISPHFYNNDTDVERALASLRKHRDLLA